MVEKDATPARPDDVRAAPPVAHSPEWRETFLARYPRNFKAGAALILVLLLVAPMFVHSLTRHHSEAKEVETTGHRKTVVEGEDFNTELHAEDATQKVYTRPSGPIVALNDQDDAAIQLAAAPDPLLTEDTEFGSLPRIGRDGRKPWRVYARPYNLEDNRPRIAIVVADMGLSRLATDAAINRLPRNVTLAFDVQSSVVGAWCARARQAGHEVILNVPMEPFDYPRSDPGAHTLLTTLTNSDNISRLNWALRQGVGYTGITTLSGSRFTAEPDKLAPIIDVLKSRGLMVFDARLVSHSAVVNLAHDQGVPVAASAGRLDRNLSPEAIDQTLAQLEQMAQLNGRAIGVVAPFPVVLERLNVWMKGLPQRGISLAPLSAMTE